VFGWTAERAASFAVLDAYVDAGGNFVDTADQYSTWAPGNSGGESERIIGEWLQVSGKRDRVLIATKVGHGYEGFAKGLAPRQIIAGCEGSLDRLGIDTIDLYYAHRDDPDTPLEDTLAAFDTLVRAGKVRQIAASNYTAPRLAQALDVSASHGLASYAVLQPELSLVQRDDYDPDVRSVVRERGLGVATYAALAEGFLAGKYRPGEKVVGSRAQFINKYVGNSRAWERLQATQDVARSHDVTTVAIAIAWVLAQPGVSTAIASATRPEQLEQLLVGTSLELAAEDLEAIG
jgi:aryl-alcohol dehydrogenase (NADP+)